MGRCARRNRSRARAALRDRIEANVEALLSGEVPGTAEGAVLSAVVAEARGRVDAGRVWDLPADLAALGLAADDATRAAVGAVVARKISDPRQDVRARRYAPRGQA